MDSPETNTKIVASSSSSDSPAVQESPFFNYLRTLSPIKPVKPATHVAQGFSELSIPTPPPVFTSPRLNPQSETIFLNRSKYSQSSTTKLSIEHGDRGHTFAAGSDVSERPITRLMVGLTPCTQKACGTTCSLQAQPSSSFGSVDEYLADPVEVDGESSSDPAASCLNQVGDPPEALQSGCIRSKEITVKVDNDGHKIMKYMEIGSDVQLTSSEPPDESLQGKSLTVVGPKEIKDGEMQSLEYPDLISEKNNDINLADSCLKPASNEQSFQHVETQTAEGGQEGKRDNNNQVLPGTLQAGEHAGVLLHESVENQIADLEEAGQNQRGTRRRCLQFEASAACRKSIATNCGFSKPASISHSSGIPVNPTDLKIFESSQLDLATTNNKCTVNSSQPMASISSVSSAKIQETHTDKFDRSVRNGGNSSLKAPLPSGIGLHLNSVVSTAAMGCTGSLSRNPTENDHPNTQRDKSPSVIKFHILDESKISSLPTIVVGKFSAGNHANRQEIQSIAAENSSTSEFPYDTADKFQELNQPSPINKRKGTYTIEEEGCKRCNCRRSKCLKLYCECFAAGIYCAGPCACQECFNKPEYEDMVLGTRQQIESRNPLAFAPKIVRRVTNSPANSGEDNNKVTPSSARHKRGCNCKKSMCLKKYCECYQSGVGCSAACRCEGCKNAFGIKEGYGEISGMASRKVEGESWEDQSDGKLVMETRSNFIHSEHHYPHNLTPLTPSFQSSNHRKDVPKSWLPGRRCLPSPESDTNGLSSYVQSPSSPKNLNTHERRARMGEGNIDIVFDQQLEFSATGRMDQSSPRWDGFEDICNLTPLPRATSKATTILSPSSSRDCALVSRVQLQGSVRLSGSLRWRSSPITPMPQIGGSKLRQESDSEIGYDILEDDTPDILKETHTPIKAVTVSSPNQKRVSPPHGHLHSLRSNSSPGLRSGRKFVLQSISSFPSLTPYSDPKDGSSNK